MNIEEGTNRMKDQLIDTRLAVSAVFDTIAQQQQNFETAQRNFELMQRNFEATNNRIDTVVTRFDAIMSEIRDIKTDIRGLQIENRRILDILQNRNMQDEQ